MIIFSQGSPNTLSMYCKIIEEVCREPLGEILFEKNGGKTKWKGDQVFIAPLGGVEIFQGSAVNPLRVLGTGEGCFKTLKEYCENFLAGSA
jgi:hypothetical protein